MATPELRRAEVYIRSSVSGLSSRPLFSAMSKRARSSVLEIMPPPAHFTLRSTYGACSHDARRRAADVLVGPPEDDLLRPLEEVEVIPAGPKMLVRR